ncbi:hypothetical protein GP486_007448 [Trichoglossum hirsutum]|uniref:Exocyst complex component Sec10 n=1 Tax=Trichoglossum hirsutum TaxID=265104 RepID=A0A9P8L2P4_9PEZI|nr:hypothetical protein GP486_007448 [Trichoglossum hirsutum]
MGGTVATVTQSLNDDASKPAAISSPWMGRKELKPHNSPKYTCNPTAVSSPQEPYTIRGCENHTGSSSSRRSGICQDQIDFHHKQTAAEIAFLTSWALTMGSIFPKGPSFTLETFSDKDFIVKDFVESLSDSAIPVNRRSAPSVAAFDPKPLIRAFEHALSRLASLSDDLQDRETELLGSVRRAEIQHAQTLESLGKKLDQTIDSFQTLDISLNSVSASDSGSDGGGQVAVKIGEKLEELDRQRRRAQDAKFLMQCWLEASERGQLSSLEEIRKQGGGEGKVRCAVIARQLMRISQRLDPGSWGQTNGNGRSANGADSPRGARGGGYNTKELIEKFSETLEKDLLKQFDHFYRRQNFEAMRVSSTRTE